MPFGIPKGARCVQRFDDSLNSAIHITYRISLRSSSMGEPRDPLLKVVLGLMAVRPLKRHSKLFKGIWRHSLWSPEKHEASPKPAFAAERWHSKTTKGAQEKINSLNASTCPRKGQHQHSSVFNNDPSAGSPTETLLRLLLPLNDQVWSASQLRTTVAGFPKPIRRPH